MRVFLGRMNIDDDMVQCKILSRQGDRGSYFGELTDGDYAFINYQGGISRLWKCLDIDKSSDPAVAQFEEVLNFNSIDSVGKFCSLSIFGIDSYSASMVHMPTTRGFLELQIVDKTKFISLIPNPNSNIFNNFINDDNNYRKIMFLKNLSNAQKSDKDIQIYKDGTKHKIYNNDKPFLNSGTNSLINSFDEDSYLKFDIYLKQNSAVANNNQLSREHKKVKRWLEAEGNNGENITIKDLWNFGCSKTAQYRNTDVSGIAYSANSKKNGGLSMSNINLKDKIKEYIVNKNCKQIILTGAPGTGKTYGAKSVCNEITKDSEKVEFVQFHPSYDYSDFVEGLRPVMLVKNGNPTFVRMDGTFKAFCRKVVAANYNKITGNDFKSISGNNEFEKYDNFISGYAEIENNPDLDKYFFIIDEINRADLSKVFGELMYCLENSYRGLKDEKGNYNFVKTQYSNLSTYEVDENTGHAEKIEFDCFKKGFFIPKNIYIIGTMNDIDRSVEAFDFALRRRFEWVEIKAYEVFLEGAKEMLGSKITDVTVIEDLTRKVIAMNNVISDENSVFMLNEHYHIGHAYFKGYNGSNLKDIFDTNIVSILKEYTRGRRVNDVNELIDNCRKALEIANE